MNISTRAFAHSGLVLLFGAIAVLGGGGLSTVLLRAEISKVAKNTRLMEREITAYGRLLAEVNLVVAEEQSAEALIRRNNEWNLGLAPPAERQIARIDISAEGRSPEERLASRRNRGLFAAEARPIADSGNQAAVPSVVFRLTGAARGR